MKTMKYLVAAAVCVLMSVACKGTASTTPANAQRSQDEAENAPTQTDEESKALVVFFSHAGDNYGVGDVEVGNTKIVADYITELTGASQFEITTTKYDGMAYTPLTELAKAEQAQGELPPFEGSVDVSAFDTIFIGGPVWWGTYPQVMFSFFAQYDLNGKTIIPFTTHEGSGLGRCVDDVRQAYPDATVTGAFAIAGHDVREGRDRVAQWLAGLGY